MTVVPKVMQRVGQLEGRMAERKVETMALTRVAMLDDWKAVVLVEMMGTTLAATLVPV